MWPPWTTTATTTTIITTTTVATIGITTTTADMKNHNRHQHNHYFKEYYAKYCTTCTISHPPKPYHHHHASLHIPNLTVIIIINAKLHIHNNHTPCNTIFYDHIHHNRETLILMITHFNTWQYENTFISTSSRLKHCSTITTTPITTQLRPPPRPLLSSLHPFYYTSLCWPVYGSHKTSKMCAPVWKACYMDIPQVFLKILT